MLPKAPTCRILKPVVAPFQFFDPDGTSMHKRPYPLFYMHNAPKVPTVSPQRSGSVVSFVTWCYTTLTRKRGRHLTPVEGPHQFRLWGGRDAVKERDPKQLQIEDQRNY